MISTLAHRAKTVCTKPELLNKEIYHLRKALAKCKYPKGVLSKVERKLLNNIQENSNTQGKTSAEVNNNSSGNMTGRYPQKDKDSKGHIVIPYTHGLVESIKKICSKYGIQTHFKGNRTIKEMLVKPKDKDPRERKSGAIYWYQCGELTCDGVHRGDIQDLWRKIQGTPKRTLIHPCTQHSGRTYHKPRELHHHRREDHGLARTINESIYIRVKNPTLIRNVGKYNLHHIWDRVLFNTPDHKINNDNGHAHRTPFSYVFFVISDLFASYHVQGGLPFV